MAITHARVATTTPDAGADINTTHWNQNHTVDLSDYNGSVAGIDFGDETLDAYDEGSWTPSVSFATPGDLSVSYSTQLGTYTRVGRLVYVTFRVVTSSFTYSSASGNFHIPGLPWSNKLGAGLTAGSIQMNGWVFADKALILVANSGSSYMQIGSDASGANMSTLTTARIASGGTLDVRGAITYETN